MLNAETNDRREKLMMLGFANLIAVGFLHASSSDFMKSLPPFAQLENKKGFTLPEDLRIAYEALKSKDAQEEKADNHVVFSLAGQIAHNIFNSRAETRKVVSILSALFNELAENTVMLPNVDGVENVKQWMKNAAAHLGTLNTKNNEIKTKILSLCQDFGLFLQPIEGNQK